jgi:hypothetical protein
MRSALFGVTRMEKHAVKLWKFVQELGTEKEEDGFEW